MIFFTIKYLELFYIEFEILRIRIMQFKKENDDESRRKSPPRSGVRPVFKYSSLDVNDRLAAAVIILNPCKKRGLSAE